jgi:hypothetical protein
VLLIGADVSETDAEAAHDDLDKTAGAGCAAVVHGEVAHAAVSVQAYQLAVLSADAFISAARSLRRARSRFMRRIAPCRLRAVTRTPNRCSSARLSFSSSLT